MDPKTEESFYFTADRGASRDLQYLQYGKELLEKSTSELLRLDGMINENISVVIWNLRLTNITFTLFKKDLIQIHAE